MKSSVIMYSLLCGLLLGALTCTLQAQTVFNNKHFTQDTTLTANGNPYEVTSDLTVSGGAILTLEAGVKMIFDRDVQFFLDGKLHVLGAERDSVYFVTKTDTTRQIRSWRKWEGITHLSTGITNGPVIEAEYMVASHAKAFLNDFYQISIKHSSFRYNDTTAATLELGSPMLVEHCYFSNFRVGIIGLAAAVISHSTFESGGTGVISDQSNIQHCTFRYNEGDAVQDQNGSVIEYCSFLDNQNAVVLTTSPTWPQGYRDTTFILHNEFRGNSNVIWAWDDSNSVNIEGTVRNNVICNNWTNLLVGDTFNIDFSQNCWCTTDTTEILNTMFRFSDGFALSDLGFLLPFETDCIPDLVYPGDANHDQVANVLDILTIGQYFGQTGPPRPNASLSWQGQEAPDWDTLQTTGYDLKHADCNGDSTIGWGDTLAIRLNYGRTHRSQRTAGVNGIPLILQAPATAQNPGDTVHLPIVLGTVDTIASNIYGIAFSIHYDSTQLVPYPSVAFFSSWLGTPRTDMITFWHIDSLAHRVDVALVRTDGQARTGFGQIAELVVVIDDDITKRDVPLRISFSGIHAIDTSGTVIPVSGFVERTVVEVEYFGNLFRTYPNPAPNFIVVEPKTSAPYDIVLVDMTGKQWIFKQKIYGKQRISMANKPGGLYILQARTGGIMESFKIMHP